MQTASGNSGAEMSIEGIREFETVRDFLYSKMRGVKDHEHDRSGTTSLSNDELAGVLREIAAEVRALRATLPAAKTSDPHV